MASIPPPTPSEVRRATLRWEWKRRTEMPAAMEPGEYIELASEASRLGDPLLCYDILEQGQAALGSEAPLRFAQLQALALARMGATEAGAALLRRQYDAGARDGETLGILGRCYKDLWERTGSEAERRRSLAVYLEAFHHPGNAADPDARLYVGINAATLTGLGGDWAAARDLARLIDGACDEAIAKTPLAAGSQGSYWRLATKAEVALIDGDLPRAERLYAEAVALVPGSAASFASTRRHARLLLEALGHGETAFDHLFPVPGVLVFTGHRPDAPGRTVPRLPRGAEAALRAQFEEYLRRHFPHGCLAFGSAAAGVDLLMLEAVAAVGGKSHVVLPVPSEEFVHASVIDCGAEWEAPYRRQIARAAKLYTLNPSDPGELGPHYHFANLFLDGMAMMEAQTLGTPIRRLAVWDGDPVGEVGGSASFVDHWRRMSYPFDTIQLGERTQDGPPQAVIATPVLGYVIKGDMQGFSTLTDRQIAAFLAIHFALLKDVWRRTEREFPGQLSSIETEGDGFLAVALSPQAAEAFVVGLRETIARQSWTDVGIAGEVRVRFALHAGPVHAYQHPFSDQTHYTGVHVIKAARIEPKTPPGQIMASQSYAALARTLGVTARFTYAGQKELAKDYGAFPMYLMGVGVAAGG